MDEDQLAIHLVCSGPSVIGVCKSLSNPGIRPTNLGMIEGYLAQWLIVDWGH